MPLWPTRRSFVHRLRRTCWRCCLFAWIAIPAAPAFADGERRDHEPAPATDSLGLARAWLASGEYARVERVTRRWWDASQDPSQDASPDAASRDRSRDVLDLLVESLWRQGFATRPETSELARRALAARDTAWSAGPASVPALLNLGAVRTQNGELTEARDLIGRACAIRRRYPGADSLEYAAALQELAALDLRSGALEAARDGFEHVLALRRPALGPHHPLVAWSLNNLATALESLGDFVGARALREECLRVRTRALPADHPDIARALHALANDHYALGDFARARVYEQRAMVMIERTEGPDSPEFARALTNMSGRLRSLGDLDGARDAAARSLAIRQRRFDPNNPEIATALLSLGRVFQESGALRAAEDTLRRALAIRARVFGAEDPITALVLDELAKTQLRLGRADSAEALCRRAIRGKSRGLGRGHPDVARSWRVLADALAAQGRTPEACRAALECERIMRDHLAASVARMPENEALAYEATRVSGLGCAARLALRPDAGPDERRSVLDAIVRSRALVLDARLSRGGGPRPSEGLPEVLRGLPQGSALVSLLRCDPEPAPFRAEARYLAFVVGAGDSAVAVVDLGAAGALDSLVGRWRAAITSRTSRPQRGVETRAGGVTLRQRVWEPLQHAIAGAPRVFIVPDGALGAVDWYALPASGGGFLVESGPLLERLSTERELSAPLAPARGSGLLVAVCGGGATGLAPLPQAAHEVRDVTQEWGDTAPGTRRAVVLSHPHATVPALRQAIQGCEVLHLSAHGVFAGHGVDPVRSLLDPAGAGEQGASVLERSGLVLAGAADRLNASGFLNARAAASLDLHGARWVVLSGCETGRGRTLTREGSLGLQRAFKLAGARVVITSLWPVEDRATREWMAALYRARWQRGLSTGQAVRAAARERLLERRRLGLSEDPSAWAGFVSTGFDDAALTAGGVR